MKFYLDVVCPLCGGCQCDDDHRYPVACDISDDFRHNAVNFTFSNGNTIDAIFGYGTYSDNYDMLGVGMEAFHTFTKSSTVESMFNCGVKTKALQIKVLFTAPSCRSFISSFTTLKM